MTQQRVWLDPNGLALASFRAAKTRIKGRTNGTPKKNKKPKLQALAKVDKTDLAPRRTQEVLPQMQMSAPPPTEKLPSLEELLAETFSMLDLSAPEGFLDSLFEDTDQRIAKKTGRARHLAQFRAALIDNIDSLCKFAAKCAELDQIRFQALIDRVRLERKLRVEQHRLSSAERAAERQEAIEDAEAEAHIAECKRRGLEAVPASVPQPLSPQEKRRLKKAQFQKKIERLDPEEKEDIVKITLGKPEETWSARQKEEVVMIENMYADKRRDLRGQLGRYL